jgi:multidrug efflux pump subunit AcrA (membrane-fusion protein)
MKFSGRKKAVGVALGILIIIILVGYRLFWYRSAVAVTVVKKAEIQSKVHGPGTVQSKVPVTVGTKITGILEKLYADQGDRVRKGQLLAELDMAELRARTAAARAAKNRAQRDLARAEADLLKAQANLGLAQSNYQRDLEVFKPGYISQAAFDNTKAALKVAESEVNASQAAVAALQAQVDQAEAETHAAEAVFAYARILAPMDGLITVRKAEVGDTVSPGTPIFQMVDYQIWAASWIDETKIAQLREGQKASIKLRSGRVYQGEVVRLNKEADTVTRELEVDVKFDTLPHPLVIGEETEVDIVTGRQTALTVPLSAIIERNASQGVLVVSNGLASFRPVVIGLQDGKRAAVLEGLREGDMVIINPAGIKPGKQVRPEIKSDTGKKNQ